MASIKHTSHTPQSKVEVTFHPDVKEYLKESFCKAKAIAEVGEDVCRDRLVQLMESLNYPPACTVLRVNTLKHTRQDTKELLKQALQKQYDRRECLVPDVADHSVLEDTLVIASRTHHVSVSPRPKYVVVDLPCGLAVWRGAEVYAPGVVGASQDLIAGDKVSVYVDVNGTCRRGAQQFDGKQVFLGNGAAVMSRKELFVGDCQPRGVTVQMTESLFDCPSLNGILADRVFLQNLPSIVVGHVINPQPGCTVLDMCAAPGGKTTHVASLMKDKGLVIALDKSSNKMNKVKRNAERLGLTCVQSYVYDSTKACCKNVKKNPTSTPKITAPPYPPETFDYILLDAPCSGLGQRPQIHNQLRINELKSFPAYQRQFMNVAVDLLKPQGTLVYSTCTVTLEENEEMVEWALGSYPQLALSIQVPHLGGYGLEGTTLNTDQLKKLQRFHPVSSFHWNSRPDPNQDTIGFFIAKFIKVGEY